MIALVAQTTQAPPPTTPVVSAGVTNYGWTYGSRDHRCIKWCGPGEYRRGHGNSWWPAETVTVEGENGSVSRWLAVVDGMLCRFETPRQILFVDQEVGCVRS